MLKRRLVKVAGLGIILVASYLLFTGGLTVAKAHLAQYLLEKSWQASRHSHPIKPWPGSDTFPVARLTIDRLDYSAIVLHGVAGESLAFGPGHLPASPTPGSIGNSVLAGHRDSHFQALKYLKIGDLITIEPRNAHSLSYRVYNLQIVNEYDLSVIENSDSREITLITCYPFNAVTPGGPLRYVASAVAVAGSEQPGRLRIAN